MHTEATAPTGTVDSSQSTPHVTPEPGALTVTSPEAAHRGDTCAGDQRRGGEDNLPQRPVLACSRDTRTKGHSYLRLDSSPSIPMVPSESQSSSDAPEASTTPETPADGSPEKNSPDGGTSPGQDVEKGTEAPLDDDLPFPELVDTSGPGGSTSDNAMDDTTDDASVYSQEEPGDKEAVVPEPGAAAKSTAEEPQAVPPNSEEIDAPESPGGTKKVRFQDPQGSRPGPSAETEAEDTAKEVEPPRENIVVIIRRKQAQRLAAKRARETEEAQKKAREGARALEEEVAGDSPAPAPPSPPAPPPSPDLRAFTAEPPGRWSLGLRSPPKFYRRAHLLTVSWAAKAAGPARELRRLLRKSYGYRVSHCGLPAHADAPRVLAAELARVVAEYGGGAAGDNTLVILHYAGASRTDASSFRICPPAWACCPAAVEVDLHSLLCDSLFSPAFAPDALALLDCAYAVENRGVSQAGKEILAASTRPAGFTFRDPAPSVRFTRGLVRKLDDATRSRPFYSDELEEVLKEAPRPPRFAKLQKALGVRRQAPRRWRGEGLRTGMGPPSRYILVSPVVEPPPFRGAAGQKKRWWWQAELPLACGACEELSFTWWSAMAHRRACRQARAHASGDGRGDAGTGDAGAGDAGAGNAEVEEVAVRSPGEQV